MSEKSSIDPSSKIEKAPISKLAKWGQGIGEKILETIVEYCLRRSCIYDNHDVLEDNIRCKYHLHKDSGLKSDSEE